MWEWRMRGINENVPIQDTFCSGIGAIEKLEGGNLRFYLYVSQQSDNGEATERMLVAKIIAPASAVPDAILKMIATIGASATKMIPMVPELVH